MSNTDKIEEAKGFAELLFTNEEIMQIMELERLTPDIEKAIKVGHLKAEAEIRKSIMDLAKNGSSAAQSYATKLIDSLKRKEY
jgi:hypothetical protein